MTLFKTIIRRTKHLILHPSFMIKKFTVRYLPKISPDKWFLELNFFEKMGYWMDFDNPRTLNEKIQWLKLYERNPLYTQLVDKIAVKEWIREQFGADYVIPTLAIYNHSDDIKLSELPDKFILKCNHDSGSYAICRNKGTFDLASAQKILSDGLSRNFYDSTKEWPYKNICPKILCEELLELPDGRIPDDYKLHFINGVLQFVYVSFDREGINDRCIYDMNWNKLPFVWVPSYRKGMNTANVPRPATFEKMKQFGAEIAKLFKYVRVDFYDVDGKLYFGEITLFHGSGYDRFYPEKYDSIYGQILKLH